MSDRTYKFGDVVEWDIGGRKVVRWLIICGETRHYQAMCLRIDDASRTVGSVAEVGASGAADERLLNG